MNLLARSTDYAVRALIHMALDEDRIVSTADLGRALDLPRPFLRKTLQALQRAGYLSSVKGVGGGFRLEVSPRELSLLDLMSIFQGEIALKDCSFRKKVCSSVRTCLLKGELVRIESMVLGRLRKVTLADLIGKRAKRRGSR